MLVLNGSAKYLKTNHPIDQIQNGNKFTLATPIKCPIAVALYFFTIPLRSVKPLKQTPKYFPDNGAISLFKCTVI